MTAMFYFCKYFLQEMASNVLNNSDAWKKIIKISPIFVDKWSKSPVIVAIKLTPKTIANVKVRFKRNPSEHFSSF
jgi:hypothetical protein